MILVVAEGEEQAVRVIAALVAAAEHEERCHEHDGDLVAARRWRRLADDLADQLDAVTRTARRTP